ncbi:MAG: Dam family site-specific DNA-(adenine-N6)-methyltransferase [Termitinemataceae bacterium]|jgi:DNA adenine methylase|nr:MAG: Dam family site-specific DNA-(adenine-N6)-methyltransferase [Termitinemataceae bacterium]
MEKAKPFIKWAGGKGQLLEQFERCYPSELKNGKIKNYVEPFLGGGALFFSIFGKYKIQNAYLSDLNRDLILTYISIQKKYEALLDFLEEYQKQYDGTSADKRNDLFLAVRKHFNEQRFEINYKKFGDNWIPRAAQFIFLNKTCFNGLFRLNSKGEFNVPFGKYKSANIFAPDNITAVSDALQNAEIVQSSYSDCWEKINNKTFVYFDPPYRPITQTSSFTTYTGHEFTDKQQIELAQFFKKLDKEKGARLMLSNSDPTRINPSDTFFEKAYKGYSINKVSANRAVNCKGAGRGKISELVITNYGVNDES